jgi:sn-glycerol 3-phosphate transport system substrate-binding protein
MLLRLAAVLLLALVLLPARAATTTIELWHAMDGSHGEYLGEIVKRFNASQNEYQVVPVYKGSYDDTVAAATAAHLQGKGPALVQVYDLATMNMMSAKNLMKPASQVLAESGERIPGDAFAPVVASYYSDGKGNLAAIPFNTSTPVLFYNKDAFAKAGITATSFKTWYDVQEALLKLYESGATRCGLTTTWPAWILIENTLAWHNEEFATKNNGFDGANAQLDFNTRLAIRHLSLMTTWVKSRLFSYSGRREEGEAAFTRGDCAMLTASSALYGDLVRNASFRFGVMPIPYYDDISPSPHHTSMGGAALWAMAGKKPAEYKGAAKFFAYVAKPETQAFWHQNTGYLPLSAAAWQMTNKTGYYEKYPGTDVAIQQMIGKGGPPGPYSRGVRLGNYAQIRAILDEEIEDTFALKKPPKLALDDAVRRGNDVLARFAHGSAPAAPVKPATKKK